MRIIVCGGRDYDDWERMIAVLDKIHAKKPITLLIEGGANGADAHAATWATNNGIPRVTCHANWQQFGSKAGPIRNATMLTLDPAGVIAFPGGKGTQNMIKQAESKGIKVMRISAELNRESNT